MAKQQINPTERENVLFSLNKEFRVIFQPKVKSLGCVVKRVRKAVGAYSLEQYVGMDNAVNAIDRAIRDTKTDPHGRCRVKLRKMGIIDFYLR